MLGHRRMQRMFKLQPMNRPMLPDYGGFDWCELIDLDEDGIALC